jgi:Dolichyl-phosphate-mannose-protein mannosyltransferase
MKNLSVDSKPAFAREFSQADVAQISKFKFFPLTLEQKRVCLVTLGAFVYRIAIYLLFADEIVASNDQMQNILLARKFFAGNFYGVLDTYWAPLYPTLIGSVANLTLSPIKASIIISLAASGLAVPVIYYFVRELIGFSEALMAALIAGIYPHLINSFFGIGTENIYLLLIVGALLAGWKNYQKPALKYSAITGLLVGLAYLTRPEAVGYLAFFAAFIFSKIKKNTSLKFISLQMITLLLTFTFFAAPYVFYLRQATGQWTVSGKMQTNLAAGMLQENAETEPEDFVPEAPQIKTLKAKILVLAFGRSLIEIQKIMAYLIPSGLMILIGLGIFRRRPKPHYLSSLLYLTAFCAVTITGYALTVSQVRYFYVLLPVFFCWLTAGIMELKFWFAEHIKISEQHVLFRFLRLRNVTVLIVLFIIGYTLPINFFMTPTDKAWRERAYEERDAGLWMKDAGTKEKRIFSASFRPVFYAEGVQIQPRKADLPELINQLKTSEADYVVISDRSLKRHEYLEEFNNYVRTSPDYQLVYTKDHGANYRIDVYRPKNL